MSDLVSQYEFAKRMGVSRSEVSVAMKSGRLTFAKGTTKLDYEQAAKDWVNNRTDSRAGNIGRIPSVPRVSDVDDLNIDSDDDDGMGEGKKFNDYKTLEIKAKAGRQDLKLQQEKGELISKDDVLKVYFGFLLAIKNSVLSSPDRVVGAIQAAIEEHMGNPDMLKTKVYSILREEHSLILTNIEGLVKSAGTEADKIAKKKR